MNRSENLSSGDSSWKRLSVRHEGTYIILYVWRTTDFNSMLDKTLSPWEFLFQTLSTSTWPYQAIL